MQNFAQIATAFEKRKRIEKTVLKGTKSLKLFEVSTTIFTSEGSKIRVDLVKTQCPKQALKIQRSTLELEGIQVYDIKTIVSPTPKRGYIAYEVVKNAHIIR